MELKMRNLMPTGISDTTLEVLLTSIQGLDSHGRKLGMIRMESQVSISSERTPSHMLDFTKLLMLLILLVWCLITGLPKELFPLMTKILLNLTLKMETELKMRNLMLTGTSATTPKVQRSSTTELDSHGSKPGTTMMESLRRTSSEKTLRV